MGEGQIDSFQPLSDPFWRSRLSPFAIDCDRSAGSGREAPKQYGGHVTIESEPGRGTAVTLYFLRAADRANYLPDSIVAQLVSVSAFLHSLDPE